jgi:hypothetical protein
VKNWQFRRALGSEWNRSEVQHAPKETNRANGSTIERPHKMTEIKLNRTGKRPLVFSGRSLASSTSKDRNSTRWVKAAVFANTKGSLIVGIGRLTCWQGESDHYSADTFSTTEQALVWLRKFASEVAEDIAEQLDAVSVSPSAHAYGRY